MSSLEENKAELVRLMVKEMAVRANSKYGKFIIQSNEVQRTLTLLVAYRSYNPTKKIKEKLERLELGSLIECFRVSLKNQPELVLYGSLKKYQDARNALAHKMYTKDRLTVQECEKAISLGDAIIRHIQEIVGD